MLEAPAGFRGRISQPCWSDWLREIDAGHHPLHLLTLLLKPGRLGRAGEPLEADLAVVDHRLAVGGDELGGDLAVGVIERDRQRLKVRVGLGGKIERPQHAISGMSPGRGCAAVTRASQCARVAMLASTFAPPPRRLPTAKLCESLVQAQAPNLKRRPLNGRVGRRRRVPHSLSSWIHG
jgi:hypothetical protein